MYLFSKTIGQRTELSLDKCNQWPSRYTSVLLFSMKIDVCVFSRIISDVLIFISSENLFLFIGFDIACFLRILMLIGGAGGWGSMLYYKLSSV